jgi:hypothetical protein
MNITTDSIVGSDAAVAKVTVEIPGFDKRTYVGTSKKHPKDQSNHAIGEQLAVSRALRKAAEDLEFQAQARVEWANHVSAHLARPFGE